MYNPIKQGAAPIYKAASDNPVVGALGGSMVGGSTGAALGALAGSGYGQHIAEVTGLSNPDAKNNYNKLQDQASQSNQKIGDILNKMKGQGQDYVGQMQGYGADYLKSLGTANANYQGQLQQSGRQINSATADYLHDLNSAKDQVQGQATNSKQAYTNTVLPKLQGLVDQSTGNAQSAMSLKDAMDPNNAVASATRGLYNTQAQGIQNQGLANYGVLAALGGQATANTIGGAGMPMTGGQISALQGQNLGAASGAFANAQNQANALKLQGLQAGQDQSNWAYGQGQNAINQATGQIGAYAGANDQYNALQNQYTNQQLGYGQQGYNTQLANAGQMMGINQDIYGTNLGQANAQYGMNSGLAGLGYGINQNAGNMDIGYQNLLSGTQQAFDVANIQAANAAQAGKLGFIGGQIGNAVGYFEGGGPFGSMAGGGGGGMGGGGGGAGNSAANTSALFEKQYQGLGSYAPTPNLPQYGGGYQPGAYGGYGQSPYGQQSQGRGGY